MADDTATMKFCVDCRQTLSADMFNRNKLLRDGLSFYCKECRKVRRKRTDDKIRERIREQHRRWKPTLEQTRASRARRMLSNPESIKRARANWVAKNAERYKAMLADYMLRHRDRHNASVARWRLANMEKARAILARRRARKRAASGEGWTAADVVARLKAQRARCAYCRIKLGDAFHRDHIVPLSRGGPHDRRNLQLLCAPCNMSKSARDPIDHARTLGRLI